LTRHRPAVIRYVKKSGTGKVDLQFTSVVDGTCVHATSIMSSVSAPSNAEKGGPGKTSQKWHQIIVFDSQASHSFGSTGNFVAIQHEVVPVQIFQVGVLTTVLSSSMVSLAYKRGNCQRRGWRPTSTYNAGVEDVGQTSSRRPPPLLVRCLSPWSAR
jgi:hypothetical protein